MNLHFIYIRGSFSTTKAHIIRSMWYFRADYRHKMESQLCPELSLGHQNCQKAPHASIEAFDQNRSNSVTHTCVDFVPSTRLSAAIRPDKYFRFTINQDGRFETSNPCRSYSSFSNALSTCFLPAVVLIPCLRNSFRNAS